jgi:prevent-host-death family protein
MARGEVTVSVSEFKAKCLDLIERVETKRIARLVLTRHGKPVVSVTSDVPKPQRLTPENWNPFLGLGVSVHVPDGLDLTAPIYDPKIDGPLVKRLGKRARK